MQRRSRLVARTGLTRRTPLVARRHATSRPARPAGPDRNTVDAVLERDGWSCAICGTGLLGERGRDWSIHHRRPRRMGGCPRPDVHLPSNLIAVCGSGTTGCHGVIESRRADAYDAGWLLHDGDVPSQRPILLRGCAWAYLTDDGRVEQAPPPVLIGGEIR